MEKAEARIKTEQAHAAFEQSRRSLSVGMNSPGARILISTDATIRSTLSLLSLLIGIGFILSLMTEKWSLLQDYLMYSTVYTGMLTGGVLLTVLLKVLFKDPTLVIGFSLLTESMDDNVLTFAAQRMDIFSIGYFGILSIKFSKIYRESSTTIFFLCISIWTILLLICYLLHLQFALISF